MVQSVGGEPTDQLTEIAYILQNYAFAPCFAVVIESNSGRLFNGFILQARREGSTVPIGDWVSIPANTQTLNCDAASDSVTHNATLQLVSTLEMRWRPSQDYGSVTFW